MEDNRRYAVRKESRRSSLRVSPLAAVGTLALVSVLSVAGGFVGGSLSSSPSPDAFPAPAQSNANPVSDVPGSVADIAAAVSPSVVQIHASTGDMKATGSGFAISAPGYIVTNYHVAVLSEDADTELEVVSVDGTRYPAELIGADQGYDLAVIKVDSSDIPVLSFGSSAALRVGDAVLAVGSPLGLAGTVTTGIVSSLNRPVFAGEGDTPSVTSAIQTDAAINPGNSGGPLVDSSGLVVGVNSSIASNSNTPGSIGLGFAIPVDTVSRVVADLIASGKTTTPILGVQLDQEFDLVGARISEVTDASAAQAAGILSGDVVRSVDGVPVADASDLVARIRSLAPGQSVVIVVTRDGEKVSLTATLAQ